MKYLQGADAQGQFAKFAFRDYQNKPGGLITEANGLIPKQPATLLSPPAPPVLDKTLTSWAELRKPANVLLVMDVSGSMGAEAEGTDTSKLALAQRAAVNALGQFSSRDQVGLWIFSTGQDPPRDYRELIPIGPMSAQVDGQPRRTVLKSRIEGLTPDGGTGLYDTSAAAFEFVKGRIDPAKINAVVLLTDGKNEDNGISVEQLLQRITTEPGAESVRLFTVAYGQDADLNVLKRIAQQTNAAAYDSLDPARIDEVFAAVISNF